MSKVKGIKKPIFPSQIILDRYTQSPILTLLGTVGAVRFDIPQIKFFKYLGITGPTLKQHLGLFGLSYQDLLNDHKPELIISKTKKEALEQILYNEQNEIRSPAKIASEFPEEILTLLYLYLRDKHLSAENTQLIEKLKKSIESMSASVDMKSLLTIAVSEYESKPDPRWFDAIKKALIDIEAGKLKAVGDQKDGSRIYTVHLSKPQVDLLDAKKVDLMNFLNYALKQYRESLKKVRKNKS